MNKSLGLKIDCNLNIRNQNNKIIYLEKSGFLLNLISELPNMFLSKMSFLDSVEHDPAKNASCLYNPESNR
jgi:hypothetical protein